VAGVLEIPDIDVHAKHLRIGNDYVRTLCVKAYPSRLPATWLAGVLMLGHRVTVSLHFEPKDPAMVRKRLLRSRSALDSRLQARLKGGWRGQAVEDQRLLEAMDEQIGDLVKGTTQFFEVSIFLGIHGTSLRQVDEVAGEVLYKLRSMSLTPFTSPFMQKQAFTACLPLGLNPDPYHSQTMDAACAAASFPFLTSSLKHLNGNLLGNHADTGSHYIVDRWEAQNYNRIVAGTSGGGKSFTVKLDMERTKMVRPWTQIYVIDPLREFDAITRNLGGQIVYVGDKSTVLNPFELQKNLLEDIGHGVDKISTNAYNRKLAFLEAFFRILLEDRLSAIEHSHLMLTLQELYQGFGITEARESHDRKPPIFDDLLALCDQSAASHADQQRRDACRNIATHLRACLLGPLSYLNGHSNVDLYADVVTFDLQSLESEHFKVFMFLVLDFINQRMYKDPTRHKVLYLDEAWILLHHPATAAVLAEMNRHTRHVMMGIDYITQTPQDFFRNTHGETIRLTCAQSLLFRQETVSAETRQSYGLDEAEADMLMRFTAAKNAGYREVLYINGTQKAHLAIFAAPEEYELGTTNPQDLAERSKARKAVMAA
jgi:type IV secretory pathway VirB4 component